MEINVNDEMKMVDIWLTNAEKNDPAVKAQLDQVYAQYKKKKYMVLKTKLKVLAKSLKRLVIMLTLLMALSR